MLLNACAIPLLKRTWSRFRLQTKAVFRSAIGHCNIVFILLAYATYMHKRPPLFQPQKRQRRLRWWRSS